MPFTQDDVLKILKIIDEADYEEIRLEIGDLKLHVRKRADAQHEFPAQGPNNDENSPMAAAETTGETQSGPALVTRPATRSIPEEIPEGLVAVRAPMLGMFYRAPSPGERPFVEIGDKVGPDDTVCLVEVMKLFNSVTAGVSGTVVKILVEDGMMVEHGQPLVLIEHDLIDAAGRTQ